MPLVEIEFQGRSMIIEDPTYLNTDNLTEQLWWIAKQNPQNSIQFQEHYYQSLIWFYQTYHHCRYPKLVKERLKYRHQRLYN